ncbi:MAG TPA: hypothetical protein VHT75_06955 [Acidimicrobiales bacterium]|jgi:hypothetical protein|nr:hypothetical protein [Acidimicrobiales bacterium]
MTGRATLSADDVLRYAFSQAPGRDFVAPLGPEGRGLTTTFGSCGHGAATGHGRGLPWGTADLLAATPYPGSCTTTLLSPEDRLLHALVAAFGIQRQEPSNLFNDHRSCASVRSRFPVHAFVHSDDEAWIVDPYRHSLLPVGASGSPWPPVGAVSVALAGRYTHLPSLYGRLRGPLVELELGISLRSLFTTLELFGLAGHLWLPGPGTPQLMDRLALAPRRQWSAPLTVTMDPSDQPWPPATGPGPAEAEADTDDDPTLDEVMAVNRTSLVRPGGAAVEKSHGGGLAVPRDGGEVSLDWAEVIWRRNSGRMPRRLPGVSGRPQTVSPTAVRDAVAWLGRPPPTPRLQEIAEHVTVSACVSHVAELASGWYRLERGPHAPATLQLVDADPALATRLESCYGHGLGPEVGCAVRHANLIWMMTADVPALVDAAGPGGWTLAQYVCGWMAHGLCLAAAAHGMYARPNRAFDEILLHPVVGTRPGEIVLLSVVSGVGRFLEPMLDLRT